jgi:hypothetical protein
MQATAIKAEAYEPRIEVRFAESDDDVIAIHRFLLAVSMPQARAPVDAQKSMMEVWRVVNDDVAIIVTVDGMMVGTMGLISPDWWYSADRFMTDRWYAVLPQHRHGPVNAALLDEATRLAHAANLELIINGKIRKSRGVTFNLPIVIEETNHVLR